MAKVGGHKKKVREEYKGIMFDSPMERDYYMFLESQMERGEVVDVILQPSFILLPAYTKNGQKVRPITYKADFRVELKSGEVEVIDVKGFPDAQFKIKKKMFDYFHQDKTLKLIVGGRPLKYGGSKDILDPRYWIEREELERLRKVANKLTKV